VASFHDLEVVAGGFEKAHQGGDAHIPIRELLHSPDGLAIESGPRGQFMLGEAGLFPRPFELLGNFS
jgi:hypothetical protein